MPACRKFFASVFVVSAFTLAGSFAAFGQSGPSVSSPTVSAPTMPTVSSPTVGGSHYMPGSETNPIYTGAKPIGTKNSSSSSSQGSQSTEENAASKKLSSTLTSSDISTLDSLGLLNQVTSLTGSSSLTGTSSTSASLLSNLYTSQNTDSTNLILQNVLKELEELKKQNAAISQQLEEAQKRNNQLYAGTSYTPVAATPAAGTTTSSGATGTSTAGTATNAASGTQNLEGSSQATAAASATSTSSAASTASVASTTTAKKSNPKILRFTVNGYSILGTCRSVYISQVQSNGSFLVTGDRRYTSDGKYRTETFHIFFNPNEAKNGISSYTTATAVSQDYLNEYSFLYQLSQRGTLTAQRTGNLVTLRTTDSNWKLEFLLDLGE